jgi:hypothetical protein
MAVVTALDIQIHLQEMVVPVDLVAVAVLIPAVAVLLLKQILEELLDTGTLAARAMVAVAVVVVVQVEQV